MDITPEYIAMCGQAKEIQDAWKFERGDYFSTPEQARHNIPSCIVDDFWLEEKKNGRKKSYWVFTPRQDQLQDMLDKSASDICYCTSCTLQAILKFGVDNNLSWYESLEKVWLRFLMWNNYKKLWNITNWIKSD